MCKITVNNEKMGIEVRFDTKPEADVLENLKANGFRWSVKQKMWYAKQTAERMEFVMSIGQLSEENNSEKDGKYSMNLFELTRTDLIGGNVNKELSVKDIAAMVRNHIKNRFPMCKFSVRVSHTDAMDIKIVSSPFAKDSDELQAIAKYFEAYAQSYNYCTSYDPYGDYGSSYRFYGAYCPIEYDYIQTEWAGATEVSEQFQKDQAMFEVEEEKRRAEEYKKQMMEREEENARYRAEQERRNAAHEVVENGAIVEDVNPYFLEMLNSTVCRKCDSMNEYQNATTDRELERHTCLVEREVRMTKDQYDIFSNQLMDIWSFVNGTGGSRCEDRRINGMIDYEQMDEEERKTVEWYSYNCVAIFCEGNLMMVVDAQGYEYCRYIYLPDEQTRKTQNHETNQAITEEDATKYRALADDLYNRSSEIIIRNQWVGEDKWYGINFEDYKKEMIQWIDNSRFPFNIHVVQAIPESASVDFKRAMYHVLSEICGIQHQFIRANLEKGQKITIVRIGDLGGICMTRATFDSFECGVYAQYDHAVRLVVRPENKRNMYYMWLYREVLIYDGWLDTIPENLFYTIEHKDHITTKMSKYMSFDHAQYDVVMEYFKGKEAKLLVNTYKPAFSAQ